MQVDDDDRIIGFVEKPQEPPPMPDDPEHCLASMGIYVFTARSMYELLCQDADQAGQRPRLRQEHHPGDDRDAQGVRATASATRTARRCRTGATSARWTPITRRTWT